MPVQLPIGYSDFRGLRERGLLYVDKTDLISAILTSPSQVVLLPRPRRFGKTLNLSALRHFVERPLPGDEADLPAREVLFADLAVWRAGPKVRRHFGSHPVIWLTFKDVTTAKWEDCYNALGEVIAAEVHRLTPVFWDSLDAQELVRLDRLRAGQASPAVLSEVLRLLSAWLHRATGQKVLILLDEYDTPLHAAHFHGYLEEASELFRNLLSGGFKDNPSLERGVLTGILRVAKASLFSGLNNLAVYTLLAQEFSSSFGFTQAEVEELAAGCACPELLPELERWYNGYRFGGTTIYNPWSILNFLASRDRIARPYWVNTASDDLLRELLVYRGVAELPDLEALLRGEPVVKPIDEHIVLAEVQRNGDALWSFLLFSGYLKVVQVQVTEGKPLVTMAIPNLEVRGVLRGLFAGALETGLGGSGRVALLCKALVAGNAEDFEQLLSDLLLTTLSYHDIAARPSEAMYQAFVAGLLVALDPSHEVTSNRESGLGRYDVLVAPRLAGGPGVVLELKVLRMDRGETAEQALQSAQRQLLTRDYAAVLRLRGAAPVHQWAVVFDGKRAWVRQV
jgi:hypothetical protein